MAGKLLMRPISIDTDGVPDLFRSTERFSYTYSGTFRNQDCKIHDYTTNEVKKCFEKSIRKIFIIGDSRSRQIFKSLEARYQGNLLPIDDVREDIMISEPLNFYRTENFDNASTILDRILNNNTTNSAENFIIIVHVCQKFTFNLQFDCES